MQNNSSEVKDSEEMPLSHILVFILILHLF